MAAQELNKTSMDDLLKKEVWTYEEYIQIFPPWSKKTIERKTASEGFPAFKEKGVTYISAAKVRIWWKRRGA